MISACQTITNSTPTRRLVSQKHSSYRLSSTTQNYTASLLVRASSRSSSIRPRPRHHTCSLFRSTSTAPSAPPSSTASSKTTAFRVTCNDPVSLFRSDNQMSSDRTRHDRHSAPPSLARRKWSRWCQCNMTFLGHGSIEREEITQRPQSDHEASEDSWNRPLTPLRIWVRNQKGLMRISRRVAGQYLCGCLSA
jgi:hypothetical protein